MSLSVRSLLLASLAVVLPAIGSAESVDFDEMPAMDDPAMSLSEEYAHLGLHFQKAGAIWSGVSEGDPGGWGLEGTNGPSFLGIDGPTYTMVMRFDWDVAALSFDVASGAPGAPGQVMVFGYRDNGFVEMVNVPLPLDGESWMRAEMSQDVDLVVALGFGSVPWGVDDMRWVGPLGDVEPEEPEEMEVVLDIKPDSDTNPVQVDAKGVLPMVVFGSVDVDVAEVDAATLRFGPGGAMPKHGEGHLEDVDGDGLMDLVLHMPLPDSAIPGDAVEACLEGAMLDGMAFWGCDLVTPVGKGKKAH